jgi:hypothetical protein
MKLTPVDCESRIANAYLCTMIHLECLAERKVVEQLDSQFDSVFLEEQLNRIQLKKNKITDMLNRLQISQSFQNIFSLLWHAKTPCFVVEGKGTKRTSAKPILSNCKWKGQDVPCSAIFSQFPTEKGMCCSFNMKAAEEMFQGETYVQLVHSHQKADRKQAIDHESLHTPNYSTQETYPGKSKGLSVKIGKILV